MVYRVTVRINAGTGEIELFQVDDLATGRPSAEHDADHDEMSQLLGGLVERRPEIEEVLPTGPGDPSTRPLPLLQPDESEDWRSARERQQN